MTAIKQTSVCSKKHLSRLKGYLSWDREKALAHDTQNIIDEERWFQEMSDTRKAMGHDRPGKAGAKCTYMQHQILGFLPDECDLNGGKMTPEMCMKYARDYVAERYPNQEVVMVLHRERCRSDGTDRYAVHLGINRSDLETGRRLDEGPARKAAATRVKTVRALDERYGLKQLERGKANSRIHARQPGKEERGMARKGQAERSENARVREAVARRIEEVGRIRECPDRLGELERRLKDDGIELAKSKGGSLQYRYYSKSLGGTRKVNSGRLGFAADRSTGLVVRFTLRGIATAMRAFWELERKAQENQNGRGD